MSELTANPEAKSGPAPETPLHAAAKTPEQLFAEWLQANNFVAYAVVAAPKGGAVTVENYTPDGWRVVIVVAEAQKANGVQR